MDRKCIDILEHIHEKHKAKIFLIDCQKNQTVTYGEFEGICRNIAIVFHEAGLKKSSKMVVSISNSINFAKIYFACLMSGIIFIPLNPLLSREQKRKIIQGIDADAYLYTSPSENKWNKKEQQNEIKGLMIIILDEFENALLINKQLLNIFVQYQDSNFKPYLNLKDEDIQTILFTSGTTGLPKGIIHTYENTVKNAKAFIDYVGIDDTNRFYNNLPMTYTAGNFNLLLLPFLAGSSVVIDHPFNASSILRFWSPIIKNNVNTIWFVPSILSILLDFDRGDTGINYCATNMKLALVGTAPLYTSVREEFEEKYGIKLHESYGLSETLFISTESPLFQVKKGSVGKLLPGIHVDQQNNLNEDENFHGEIVVQSPYLMKGYYDDPKPADQWFNTGDIGYEKEQYIYITGRKKEIIIHGGINVSPNEIENIILVNNHVHECAVIGLPHDIMGEEIVAVVNINPKENIETTLDELVVECSNKLAMHQIPSRFIPFAKFPRSPSGKIMKEELKKLILEQKII